MVSPPRVQSRRCTSYAVWRRELPTRLDVVQRKVDSPTRPRRAVNRLGHLHVTQAFLEVGRDRRSSSDRVDEIRLGAPFADQLHGNLDRRKRGVALPGAQNTVGRDRIDQGSFAAVQLDSVFSAEVDAAAEVEDRQAAASQGRDDADTVGDLDRYLLNRALLWAPSGVIGHLGRYPIEVADPAVEHLDEHAQIESVEARNEGILDR